MVTILNVHSPIVDQYLQELRDVSLQKDRLRFTRNLKTLGTLLGYELSSQLEYEQSFTTTPHGKIETKRLAHQVVLATILRAGLPVQRGLQQVFTTAELAFIGAKRHRIKSQKAISVELGYIAAPALEGKVLILADTMLATGHSLVSSYRALIKTHGQPRRVYIAAVIASQPGVEYVCRELPEAELLICAVDPKLDNHSYIVPGLGDAGDILYGPKL